MKKLSFMFLLVFVSSHHVLAQDDKTSSEDSGDSSYEEPPEEKLSSKRVLHKLKRNASILHPCKRIKQHEKKTIKRNISCHFCRTNTEKNGRKRGQNYCTKPECRQVYCNRCLNRLGEKLDPCPMCKGDCCCQYELCEKPHEKGHCHTYNRTIIRHDGTQKWIKKKRHERQTVNEGYDPIPSTFINRKFNETELPRAEDKSEDSSSSAFDSEEEDLFRLLGNYLRKFK